MSRVVVVGSINADLTVQVERHPVPGETLLGTGGEVNPGGKGANQAVAAARAGARVALVSAVGNDAYAAPATRILRASGVALEAVETVDGVTGLAVITVSSDGENSIIVVPGANAAVDAVLVNRHVDTIRDAEIVLVQGEIPASGIVAAAHVARRLVVNLAPVIELPREVMLRADPLIVNEHEAALLLRHWGLPEHGGVQGLLDAGVASIVMTIGSRGAIVADAEGITPIPTPAVTPVDTTGAGDAFAGVLAARLAAGEGIRAAARQATRYAADSTTRPGAQISYSKTLPG